MEEREKNISIKGFYTNNKEIIGMKQKDFFNWVTENYYANCIKTGGKNRYVATNTSIEEGYMVNRRMVVIDIDDFNVIISYSVYITPKGQEHLLKIFGEGRKMEDE